MDSELTALDDWVGTLEELQLGLERKCGPASSNCLSTPSFSKSSYSGPYHLTRSPAVLPSPRPVAQILSNSPAPPPRRNYNISPSLPSPALTVSGKDADCLREERVSIPITKTLTQSIRASFNSLSCREVTAENDLDCLLRQLEEVENTMKQLEQDNKDFTRRYSLVSSSTTDPSTGCNPSPAPDVLEQISSPLLPPLVTNGNTQSNIAKEQSANRVEMKPVLPSRSLTTLPPSSPATDYEVADEVSAAIFLAPSTTARFISIDDASPERDHQQEIKRHHSVKATASSSYCLSSSSSSFHSSSGISSVVATRPPIPPPESPLGLPHLNTYSANKNSPSGKSTAEIEELSKKLDQVVDLADRLHLNKLVVRIFRPDRTTKAILIDQGMTAGEVASMLVEKNFLQPSIKLCLVEKVPSLKVERIFEESELVAECILAWPVKSQNMIFFESRDDQFGFIESPNDWLGVTHDFHSNTSVQTMLEKITCSGGLAEWRDFLYIRKPGEKTWARRMCILRNSGLYAVKRNKKATTASKLVRLLGVDNKLHIYTTTGGWSRMRAPTPHGFALKTYAAQDFSSSHVFCFCASNENALKQWACRLRLAKFGIHLLRDYQTAMDRVAKHLKIEPQNLKSAPEPKQLICQSPVECTGHFSRLKASDCNLLLSQRAASLTPKLTTAIKCPVDSYLQKDYTKHPSNGASPEHFYIR